MECGLVNGFGSDMAADDFVVVSGDDFSVDELLDFSNGFEEEEQPQQQPDGKEQDENSASPENSTAPENSGLTLSDDFGSLPESELSIPVSLISIFGKRETFFLFRGN